MAATTEQENATEALALEFDRAWGPQMSPAGNAGVVCVDGDRQVLVLLAPDGGELARTELEGPVAEPFEFGCRDVFVTVTPGGGVRW